MLRENDIKIARRTVAKYRSELGLLSSSIAESVLDFSLTIETNRHSKAAFVSFCNNSKSSRSSSVFDARSIRSINRMPWR